MYPPTVKRTTNGQLIWQVFAMLMMFLSLSVVHAVEYESLDNIHHTAQSWLKSHFADRDNIEFRIGHIDDRLNMIKCNTPLDVSRPDSAKTNGHTTLKVRCNNQKAWQVYIPVRIFEYIDVLVANQSLPRGTYLQQSDVTKVKKDVSRLHNGYFTKLSEINDMVTKRSLRKGRILTPGVITPPRLVKRGESITILAKSGTLVIRVKGRALMDGKMGDRIRVKNVRSKRDIQATVVSSGTVQVSM